MHRVWLNTFCAGRIATSAEMSPSTHAHLTSLAQTGRMVAVWSRTRMVASATTVVAAAGIVAVVTKDGPSECDSLNARLAAIEGRYSDEAAQSWDEILVLQDDVSERGRILRDLAANECS